MWMLDEGIHHTFPVCLLAFSWVSLAPSWLTSFPDVREIIEKNVSKKSVRMVQDETDVVDLRFITPIRSKRARGHFRR